jgi:hypothetical protein
MYSWSKCDADHWYHLVTSSLPSSVPNQNTVLSIGNVISLCGSYTCLNLQQDNYNCAFSTLQIHLTADLNSQSVSSPVVLGKEGTKPVSCNRWCQVPVLRLINYLCERTVRLAEMNWSETVISCSDVQAVNKRNLAVNEMCC